MDRDSSAARMTTAGKLHPGQTGWPRGAVRLQPRRCGRDPARRLRPRRAICRMWGTPSSPVLADSTEQGDERDGRQRSHRAAPAVRGHAHRVGAGHRGFLAPATSGRLRDGYTADTLNIILCGDNRPGYRLSRLQPQLLTIRQGVSLNPIKIVRGLINIPCAIVKGLYPDLALIREMPCPRQTHAEVGARASGDERDDGEDRFAARARAERRGGDQHRRSRAATGDTRRTGSDSCASPSRSPLGCLTSRRREPRAHRHRRTASRTGGPRPACRSAATVSITASTPPTGGCGSSRWTRTRSSTPAATGRVRSRSSTRRRNSPGWWRGSRSTAGR